MMLEVVEQKGITSKIAAAADTTGEGQKRAMRTTMEVAGVALRVVFIMEVVDSTIVREWEAAAVAAVVEEVVKEVVEVAHMEQEAMARVGSMVEVEVAAAAAAAAEEVSIEVKKVNRAQEVKQVVRKSNESMGVDQAPRGGRLGKGIKGHMIIANKAVRDPLSKSLESPKQLVGACIGSGTDIILCE